MLSSLPHKIGFSGLPGAKREPDRVACACDSFLKKIHVHMSKSILLLQEKNARHITQVEVCGFSLSRNFG
jgi:hypothetical protein